MAYARPNVSGTDICKVRNLSEDMITRLMQSAMDLANAEVAGCGQTDEEQQIATAIRDAAGAGEDCALFKQLELSIGAIIPDTAVGQQKLEDAWSDYSYILNRIFAAGGDPMAEVYYNKATEQFIIGNFTGAYDFYWTAYKLSPRPELLFDMAQCQRSLGNNSGAVALFIQYLEHKPDAANRASVEKLIVDLSRAAPPTSPVAGVAVAIAGVLLSFGFAYALDRRRNALGPSPFSVS